MTCSGISSECRHLNSGDWEVSGTKGTEVCGALTRRRYKPLPVAASRESAAI